MKRILQITALLAFLAVVTLTAFPPRVNFFYASPDGVFMCAGAGRIDQTTGA